MDFKSDHTYGKYVALGGKLCPQDHIEIRRRTTQTGRVYDSKELSGLAKAQEVAERHKLSITERVAAAYHHLRESFLNYFKSNELAQPDEREILREALAIEGDASQIAKLH